MAVCFISAIKTRCTVAKLYEQTLLLLIRVLHRAVRGVNSTIDILGNAVDRMRLNPGDMVSQRVLKGRQKGIFTKCGVDEICLVDSCRTGELRASQEHFSN